MLPERPCKYAKYQKNYSQSTKILGKLITLNSAEIYGSQCLYNVFGWQDDILVGKNENFRVFYDIYVPF